MEYAPFTDDLPTKMVIFHSYVKLPEAVIFGCAIMLMTKASNHAASTSLMGQKNTPLEITGVLQHVEHHQPSFTTINHHQPSSSIIINHHYYPSLLSIINHYYQL